MPDDVRVVKFDGRPFPFRGVVTWLTTEEGGRRSGPPLVHPDVDFAQLAFVPPRTAETGLASFVLRGFASGAWTSRAEGRWMIVENQGDQLVVPGSTIVVAEGSRIVAHFLVDEVDQDWHPFT